MKQNFPNNSLSLLSNTSGWCKLLLNTDKELNLQHRFSNNLYHSLNQSKIKCEYYKSIIYLNS